MVDYKKDYQYAKSRLVDTVCIVKGLPRRIYSVNGHGKVLCKVCGGFEEESFNLAEVENAEFPLGFINLPYGEAVYLTRTPKKQYKQGLNTNNTVNLLNGKNFNPDSKYLVNTVLGIYPTIDRAMEQIEVGEGTLVAFNRHYAVGGKVLGDRYKLFYKAIAIGDIGISPYGKINVNLEEQYHYMKEDVEEKVYA